MRAHEEDAGNVVDVIAREEAVLLALRTPPASKHGEMVVKEHGKLWKTLSEGLVRGMEGR